MTLHEALEELTATDDAPRRITPKGRVAHTIKADMTGEADRTPAERLRMVETLQKTVPDAGRDK
jgi:hypothetical protein